jgi:hypothetical protein
LAYIQVPPDSTGKKIDASQVTTGDGQVLRESNVTADPVDASALQNVRNAAPGANDYGGLPESVMDMT